MAATDRLIITYTGNDERTNIARPPAVPGRRAAGRRRARRCVVQHPLQPFDPRNFDAAAVPGKPWSFDRVTLGGRAGAGGRRAPSRGRSCSAPLPPREPGAAGARRPRALRRAPRARVPAPAARDQRRRLLRRGRRRAAGRARRAGALGRRRAAAGRADGGTDGADRDPRRDRRAASSRRASSACPVVREIWQGVDEIAGRARALIGAAEAESVDVKVDARRAAG